MKKLLVVVAILLLVSGCATVPMGSDVETQQAKEVQAPSGDNSGIYLYRKDTVFGAALTKSIWIDGECIGDSAKGVFFYHEVEGDKDHTISTQSEFSPNDLIIHTKAGELYFVEQFIKMGVFVGGAGLEQKDPETGRKDISELKLAQKGECAKPADNTGNVE